MARIKKGDNRTPEQQKAAVLEAIEEYGNITEACKKKKIPRRTFYNWLEDDEFKKSFNKAMKLGVGGLEDEARRRAFKGTVEPVFYKGEKVGTVRNYSDTLLIVLLKAHAPNKYKERLRVGHSGVKDAPPILTEVAGTVLVLPANGREIAKPAVANAQAPNTSSNTETKP